MRHVDDENATAFGFIFCQVAEQGSLGRSVVRVARVRRASRQLIVEHDADQNGQMKLALVDLRVQERVEKVLAFEAKRVDHEQKAFAAQRLHAQREHIVRVELDGVIREVRQIITGKIVY